MVYLDLVGLLNFLVDFFLLLAANRLAGFPAGVARAFLAAVLGGVYGAVCLIPGWTFLGGAFWRLVVLALMSAIAFGINLTAIRRAVLFILLSMALGGIAMGANRKDFGVLLLCALCLWTLCAVGFRGPAGARNFVTVEIPWEDRKLSVVALRDTGNLLKDPVTGEPVLVAAGSLGGELLGLSTEELACPVQTLARGKVPGLRLIPYRTVGGASMMLACRFHGVKIGNRYTDPLIAFSDREIDASREYRILTGGV